MRTKAGCILAEIGPGWAFLHVGSLCEFHLDGVKAIGRAAIVPGGPTALKATIDDGAVAARIRANIGNGLCNAGITGSPVVGSDVEIRQHSVKQEWNF